LQQVINLPFVLKCVRYNAAALCCGAEYFNTYFTRVICRQPGW